VTEIQAYLSAEWQAVAHAPVLFFAALIAIAIVIWRLMEWRYEGEIQRARGLTGDQVDLTIRQRGSEAGVVVAPSIDRSGKVVILGHLYSAPHFDEHQTFEFRGMVLMMRGHAQAAIIEFGTTKRIIYTNAGCEIVG
jgi:hypothetical protein